MRHAFGWKLVLAVALLVVAMTGSAVASLARPREERLVFPNVVDDAAEDTYSPLIWCFLGGTAMVGSARAVVMRRRRAEEVVVKRTLL